MTGLQRICKLYWKVNFIGSDGNKIVWLWDYVKDEARLETEMSKEDIMSSEKAKWMAIKNKIM
jgi:hypothetical protein